MNSEVRIVEGVPLEQDPRPIVELPRPGVPGLLIAVIALVAAVLLFVLLDAQRREAASAAEQEQSRSAPITAPPPLVVPQETVAQPALPPVVAPRSAVPPVIPPAAAQPRFLPPAPEPPLPPPLPVIRQDMRPLPPPRIADPPQPSLSHPALVMDSSSAGMPVGTLIPAVLETPIDTSRPGLARAVVYRNTFAGDGRRLLVPRGSRLIGEYLSDVRAGQNRVLVNWTRLILPNGATLRLAAPSADELGGAGIPGRSNSFFLTRFLNAALQTALSVGGSIATGGATNTVVVGMPAAAGATLAGSQPILDERRPRIRVKQGTLFNVFVAREVDFSSTPPVDRPATVESPEK